jgi:uncharacterized protein (DUF697 family)
MIGQEIRGVESAAGHILRAVGRAFVKVLTGFLAGGVVGAGAVEGVQYFHNGGFSSLGHIAAAVFGVVLGYAVGLTMAVGEAIRALLDAGKEAAKGAENLEKTVVGDAEKVAGGAESGVGSIVKAIGGEFDKKK